MGVVSGGAVLHRLPSVGCGVANSGGTLGDGEDAVVLVGVILSNAVEVDATAVVGGAQGVCDVHDNCVAPVCVESCAWGGSIDGFGEGLVWITC